MEIGALHPLSWFRWPYSRQPEYAGIPCGRPKPRLAPQPIALLARPDQHTAFGRIRFDLLASPGTSMSTCRSHLEAPKLAMSNRRQSRGLEKFGYGLIVGVLIRASKRR
jgi:hypothetical protein